MLFGTWSQAHAYDASDYIETRPYTQAMFTLYRIVKRSVAKSVPDRACSHWERFATISAPQQNINSCSHCTGATFETEQKPIRYSVNIVSMYKGYVHTVLDSETERRRKCTR